MGVSLVGYSFDGSSSRAMVDQDGLVHSIARLPDATVRLDLRVGAVVLPSPTFDESFAMWFARALVPIMTAREVEIVLTACTVRRLNPNDEL